MINICFHLAQPTASAPARERSSASAAAGSKQQRCHTGSCACAAVNRAQWRCSAEAGGGCRPACCCTAARTRQHRQRRAIRPLTGAGEAAQRRGTLLKREQQGLRCCPATNFSIPCSSGSAVVQRLPAYLLSFAGHVLTSVQLNVQSNPHAILVSLRQKGNPLLQHIRSVRWQYADILPDYQMGAGTCALFLSLR